MNTHEANPEERIALPYDPNNKESIILYAQSFEGKTLRTSTSAQKIQSPKRNKGSFGSAVEELVFLYAPNSKQEPDFDKVNLELKTTPFKRLHNKALVSKERLVLSTINYNEVVNESFESSSLLKKASDILLFAYIYDAHKDPLDYEIFLVKELSIPQDDLPLIKKDWETIVNKVRHGEAHLISGADTLYLEACTKAANSRVRRSQPYSDEPAKPRAWAFKPSYVTNLLKESLNAEHINRLKEEEGLSLISLIKKRFNPYFGKSIPELAELLGIELDAHHKPKQITAILVKKILGIGEDSQIEEFLKAGIKTKALRLKANGSPKESLSFAAFSYFEVASVPFEESEFYRNLLDKYLFVIFCQDNQDSSLFRLSDVILWQMPEKDLMTAKACYDQMRDNINAGRADVSVKSSENAVVHVRPHARNRDDKIEAPGGQRVIKKSFWLNASYIANEIKRKDSQK